MPFIANKIKDKLSGTSALSGQHLAAVLTSKSQPFDITHCLTPTPGPNDLLVEVKPLAINPIDFFYQRAFGLAIKAFPAIPGSKIAGAIIAAGSSMLAKRPQTWR